MLSGGLTPENVGAAVTLTGASGGDVSSGVEHRPGEKDSARIRAFIKAATHAIEARAKELHHG
jgi:phosphoribosylanthranilate isomerase